jgi:hypothetical protein
MAGATGLEPATPSVTGWYSNQLSYAPGIWMNFGIARRENSVITMTCKLKFK